MSRATILIGMVQGKTCEPRPVNQDLEEGKERARSALAVSLGTW